MNAFEAQYFHALNEARTNPAGFAQYLEDMRDNYKTKEDGTKIFLYKDAYGENAFYQVEEGISALNEAIEFLQAQEPLRPVKRLAELDMSSHVHLDDQIEGNFFGHYGSDKSAPHQRIERFLFPLGTGENLEYSTTTARMKIIRLIIDDGFRDSEVASNFFCQGAVTVKVERQFPPPHFLCKDGLYFHAFYRSLYTFSNPFRA
jgi:hypothetical protein